ncbi:unnamed protein product [Phyllotreta striolata]|uniref:Uncharacterized protein n=1 Tax=Phyllotreta striolata TaxID=444603 RepID=A0A9N9XNS3_PHYSR|nr:unnamed protein product [Phyllotreta striolata]
MKYKNELFLATPRKTIDPNSSHYRFQNDPSTETDSSTVDRPCDGRLFARNRSTGSSHKKPKRDETGHIFTTPTTENIMYYANLRLCDHLIPYLTGFNANQGVMSPGYALQTVVLGATVVLAVLVIGFLVILDRMRMTSVVRARRFSEPTAAENVLAALGKYENFGKTGAS